MANIYNKLFEENKIDIIETIKLAEFIEKGIGTNDEYQRTKLASSLINVKAIRNQTKAIKLQTKELINNSNSSDKLSKEYNNLTKVMLLLIVVQIIIALIK